MKSVVSVYPANLKKLKRFCDIETGSYFLSNGIIYRKIEDKQDCTFNAVLIDRLSFAMFKPDNKVYLVNLSVGYRIID